MKTDRLLVVWMWLLTVLVLMHSCTNTMTNERLHRLEAAR